MIIGDWISFVCCSIITDVLPWNVFAKLFAGRLTSSEKSCILYDFKKFMQKFCWYQSPRDSIWSQESYKLSRLPSSLTSREKSLKLSWSGLLPRPPWVDLSFYLFVSCVWGREEIPRFPCVTPGDRELPLRAIASEVA